MTFTLDILRSAKKSLAKIHPSDRNRIIDGIRNLANNPYPDGCRKLTGREAWRIRVGSYRIIYEIQNARLRILIVAIGHRKDIYQ